MLYPPIESNEIWMLKVSDIHSVYIEESGNPRGIPVLFVHGGPGGGTQEKHRQYFDPNYYRIILFDQRGCGKSLPFGEIRENTTQDLIADMEKIREHLHIDSWILFGGSWGSVLSLAYAIEHSERVKALVLRGIFLGTQEEIDLFINPDGSERFFPESFEKLSEYFGGKIGKSLLDAYQEVLHGEDMQKSIEAARIWTNYEGSLCRLEWRGGAMDPLENPLAMARLEIHYFQNQCFLPENYILKQTYKLKNIPIKIFQGRYDIVCPPMYAYRLHKTLSQSQLTMLLAGHSGSDPEIRAALVGAMEELKSIKN